MKIYVPFFIFLSFTSLNAHAYWSCAWPYKTEITVQENSGSNLTNYQVEISISGAGLDSNYNWTDDGFDLRVVDTDDETLLDFWLEDWDDTNETATVWVRFDSLLANEAKTIYLYYGNEYADTLANVPFTFVEPGIKFHTRNVTSNPASLSEAESLFDAADDNTSGFGCGFITDFTGITNQGQYGSQTNFIAFSETYFEVQAGEEGTWEVRYGADFGNGGGLYVNGAILEEDWGSDLWWESNWSHPDVLQGTIDLTEGYHKLEVIGGEGCCDGGITVQFQKPGGSFTTYSTANIDIVSRACPVTEPTVTFGVHDTATCPSPIVQYRLDESSWPSPGDVDDFYGASEGTMLGTVNNVSSSQVCSGAIVANNASSVEIDAIQTAVDVDADIGNVGSIAFWVKTELDWNSGTDRTLFDASLDDSEGGSDKYFYLEKLSDGRLEFSFEDSDDGDYTLTESSVPSRVAGTWYHITVTWDMPADAYEIFVADESVASDSISTNDTLSDLTNLHVGDNASSLYTIASGNSANASFDEITIYNTVLSVSEIRGLMAVTRACATITKYCGDTFPDGLASIGNNKSIDFGQDAQLLNNPDTQLSADSINLDGGSSLLSCDSAECTNGDPDVNDVAQSAFDTTNATNDVTVAASSTGTIGDTTNEYDRVTVNSGGELTVAAGYSEYFIDRLILNNSNSVVNFTAGTYWIRRLTMGTGATLNVSSGPVRLYVRRVVSWSDDTLINSPSAGNSGSAEDLLMYFYQSATLGNSFTFSGTMYGQQNLTFGDDSFIFGLVSGENITLGDNTKATYDESAYSGLSDISWCDETVAGIGSIIITAASTGINCLASAVDVTIYNTDGNILSDYENTLTLTTDVNHGDWSKDASANGTLTQASADSGSATYGMLSSDGGMVNLYLNNTHPETTTITAEAEGITDTHAITFSAAGFVFKNDGAINNIPNQLAAKDSDVAPNDSALSIEAVDTVDDGSCQALLVDTEQVQFALECLNPTSCASATASINSDNVSPSDFGALSYSAVNLDFGNSSSSEATFNLNYSEAGQVRLHAYYELLDQLGSATGETISVTSNSFVVSPYGFCIEPSSSESNWQCTVPGVSASCSAFKQAGDNFNLDVIAKAWNNSGTTDFCDSGFTQTQNFNLNLSLSHSLVAPSGGDAGTFSSSSVALSSGQNLASAQSFSELAVFTLTVGGDDYFGETLPTTTSENIGRFYAKDFSWVSSSAATYDDANTGFSYVGELNGSGDGGISYNLVPSFNFHVRGFNNQLLKNYIGDYAHDPSITVSVSSNVAGNSTDLNVTSGFNIGVISGPDASSEYTYTFDALDHFVFDREDNSLIDEFSNDIQLNISDFSESIDSASLAGGTINISGSGGLVRYGRLNINNAYGAETSAVNQSWQMEYFNGSDFVFNSLDSGTSYDVSLIGSVTVTDVGDSGDPLLSTDTSASGEIADTGFFTSGELTVIWAATTGARYGTIRFPYSIDNWLQYDWQGSGDEDPQASVTFGQYRGHDNVIYWKEINY
jgi:MSHA biogenesis protein MshQ